MKTKIIVALISYSLLVNENRSFSQVALNGKETNHVYLTSLVTNTILNAGADAFNLNASASNVKVQRSFISYFGETAENNWSMVGKDFLNRFHSNGVLINALFDKQGRPIYIIRYGTEKNLPADVRKIIKSEYYDYAITMAIEVKENYRDIWVVKLDNSLEQTTVRVEDNEIEQVQQFQNTN